MPLDRVADNLGVGLRTLRRHQAEGAIVPVQAAAGRRAARYDALAVARVLLGAPEDATAARAARDSAQAELLRLRIDRERGAVFAKDTIIRAGRGAVEAARARLLRLPSDLARAGLVSAEGEELAEGIVREALEELARLRALAEGTAPA